LIVLPRKDSLLETMGTATETSIGNQMNGISLFSSVSYADAELVDVVTLAHTITRQFGGCAPNATNGRFYEFGATAEAVAMVTALSLSTAGATADEEKNTQLDKNRTMKRAILLLGATANSKPLSANVDLVPGKGRREEASKLSLKATAPLVHVRAKRRKGRRRNSDAHRDARAAETESQRSAHAETGKHTKQRGRKNGRTGQENVSEDLMPGTPLRASPTSPRWLSALSEPRRLPRTYGFTVSSCELFALWNKQADISVINVTDLEKFTSANRCWN
jgi:hypothetical protein